MLRLVAGWEEVKADEARATQREQIISKLREAEVLLQKDQAVAQVCRQLGVGSPFIEPRSRWENGHVGSAIGRRPSRLLSRRLCWD
jgi:hypothetical protein